jgi:hypothetical protein
MSIEESLRKHATAPFFTHHPETLDPLTSEELQRLLRMRELLKELILAGDVEVVGEDGNPGYKLTELGAARKAAGTGLQH